MFIRDQGNDILYWPSNCPDLSPIETVRSIVKRHIGWMPKIKDRYLEKRLTCQIHLKTDDIKLQYSTMQNRIQAVIRAKGGLTKYKMTSQIKPRNNNDLHLLIYCNTKLKYIQYVDNFDTNHYLDQIWKAAVHCH